jgi:hypothetical protein
MVGSMAPPLSSGQCAVTRRPDPGNGCRLVRDALSCPRRRGRVLVTRHRCACTGLVTPPAGWRAPRQAAEPSWARTSGSAPAPRVNTDLRASSRSCGRPRPPGLPTPRELWRWRSSRAAQNTRSMPRVGPPNTSAPGPGGPQPTTTTVHTCRGMVAGATNPAARSMRQGLSPPSRARAARARSRQPPPLRPRRGRRAGSGRATAAATSCGRLAAPSWRAPGRA